MLAEHAVRTMQLLMPDAPIRSIARAFDLMEIAENEIKRAKKRWPKKQQQVDIFGALKPGALSRYADDLYVFHCRELLDRAHRGEDLRPGTRAEMLVALSEASLKAPLENNATAAYEYLFRLCFPGKAPAGEPVRPSWPRAVEELLHDMARKLAKDDRGPARGGA